MLKLPITWLVYFLIPSFANLESENKITRSRVKIENAYERAGRSRKNSPHCIQYELSHCVEEPKNYVLRIEWDSQNGHLKGFPTSPEFQTFFKTVRPFFNEIEEMHHYEVMKVMRRGRRSTSIS